MVKSVELAINSENRIIKSHSIYGQYLLPGLGYIDLLYQLSKKLGINYRTHSIQNLAIQNSLIVSENQQVTLHITYEQKEDIWFVQIADKTCCYATAEFHPESKCYQQQIRLQEEMEKAQSIFDMDSVYESARKHELVHTGIMKVDGKCYLSDKQLLVAIEVVKEYQGKENFLFHPALIDGAGMAGGAIRGDSEDNENLYVPLCYEYFYCTEKITEKCFARILKSSVREINEIRTSSMEIFNEDGKQIGELAGVTSKKIRMRGQIQRKPDANKNHKIEKPEVIPSDEHLETSLKELFSRYLNIESQKIEEDTGFFELGLESAQLLDLHHDIEALIGMKLNQTTLFEYTTIKQLADYIIKQSTKKEHIGEKRAIVFEEEKEKCEEDIAIIGLAGYFPEAENIDQFWENIKNGKDCITEVPKERWDWRKYQNIQTPLGKTISKWGGFISDPAEFDAEFFHIAPREAEIIDPQERLFLQCCWKTLEDAGYTPDNVCKGKDRKVGVYVGVMHKDYALIGLDALNSGKVVPLSLNYAPIANRVSYYCDFHGPSMALDTVCSSSLLSLHLAIESIQKGESEVALAGGVNLSLHPAKYVSYGLAGMHSSNGACRTFGTNADGYVSSDGIGAVLLKPISKAIKDNDKIYAVIKKTAVNHGGKVSGLTVPSPIAQGNLIDDCLQQSKINPRTIQYVEAHGTGTSLGDPIEIQGLMNAFEKYTDEKQFCSIGSVKSNIGHAESAAGIAGIIKVCLQLYNKMLVPSLHSEEVNPMLDFENSAFYIQKKTEPWERAKIEQNGEVIECKRRAAISAFGATGTNVHAILEEYEQIAEQDEQETGQVCFVLSARNEERLQQYIKDYIVFLKRQDEEFSLGNMAYTMSVGRMEFDERIAIVASNVQELIQILEKVAENRNASVENMYCGNVRKVDKMFKQLMGQEEWSELVEKWIKQKNVKQFAKLWVAGIPIDWNHIYENQKVRRISLPTYPFANTRYWITKHEDVKTSSFEVNTISKDANNEVKEEKGKKTLTDFFKQNSSIKIPSLSENEDSDVVQVEEKLKELLSDELRITSKYMDAEADIKEFGVEQIHAVNIMNRLNEFYHINIEVSELYGEGTIHNIADLIQRKRNRLGIRRIQYERVRKNSL